MLLEKGMEFFQVKIKKLKQTELTNRFIKKQTELTNRFIKGNNNRSFASLYIFDRTVDTLKTLKEVNQVISGHIWWNIRQNDFGAGFIWSTLWSHHGTWWSWLSLA